MPGFDMLPATPLAPREGVASGSSAALSRSVISADSGIPRGVPVASSTTIVWLPLRSVGSKIYTGPILPIDAVL